MHALISSTDSVVFSRCTSPPRFSGMWKTRRLFFLVSRAANTTAWSKGSRNVLLFPFRLFFYPYTSVSALGALENKVLAWPKHHFGCKKQHLNSHGSLSSDAFSRPHIFFFSAWTRSSRGSYSKGPNKDTSKWHVSTPPVIFFYALTVEMWAATPTTSLTFHRKTPLWAPHLLNILTNEGSSSNDLWEEFNTLGRKIFGCRFLKKTALEKGLFISAQCEDNGQKIAGWKIKPVAQSIVKSKLHLLKQTVLIAGFPSTFRLSRVFFVSVFVH